MADRYWVGGAGAWTATSTTNWSTAAPIIFTASSSGTTLTTVGSPALVAGMQLRNAAGTAQGTIVSGSGNTWTLSASFTNASQSMYAYTSGASAPTTADNVFFPVPLGLSYLVTTSGVLGVADFNGTVAGVTWGGASTLTIAGSITTVAGTSLNYSGSISFTGSGAKTIAISNGLNNAINFNNATGVWTLNAALSTNSAIAVTAGSLVTNNYALTGLSLNSTGTSTRSISLGSSAVTLTGASPISMGSTGLTFNAGTSEITANFSSVSFGGGGCAFYNVTISNAFLSDCTFTGVNTFNNLTFESKSGTPLASIILQANQAINGTLTIKSSTGANARHIIRSDVLGTVRTLSIANFATAFDPALDFRDITITGAAAPISGTKFGNCRNNTGITFPAAKTVYFVGSASWTNATAWSSTAGGAGSASSYPLAQDTAVFGNTYPAASTTITLAQDCNFGTIDMSGRTAAMTLANASVAQTVYGSVTLGTGVTMSGTSAYTFRGDSLQVITTNGRPFVPAMVFNSLGSTVQLADALTSTANITTLASGTLDLNGKTLTGYQFTSTSTSTRQINFNGGSMALAGAGTVFTTLNPNTLTVTGTPTVTLTNSGTGSTTISTVGATESNVFDFTLAAGSYTLTISTSSAIGSLTTTGFTGVIANGTRTIYGNLTLGASFGGSGAGLAATTFGGTGGTRQITMNGKNFGSPVTFNGPGRTWVLQDALSAAGNNQVLLTAGTIDLNGKTATVYSFASTGTLARNITFNGGSLICTSATTSTFTVSGTGFTTTAGSALGQISMTAASAKTFVGAGMTYACALNQGGAGALTISGSNKFTSMTNTAYGLVWFVGGTTNEFSSFNLNGLNTTTKLSLGSTNTTPITLKKPGPWLMGANSTNNGNNTNLSFTAGGMDYLIVSYVNGVELAVTPTFNSRFFAFF